MKNFHRNKVFFSNTRDHVFMMLVAAISDIVCIVYSTLTNQLDRNWFAMLILCGYTILFAVLASRSYGKEVLTAKSDAELDRIYAMSPAQIQNEIKKAEAEMGHYKQQIDDLRTELKALETKFEEQSKAHRAACSALSQQIDGLSQKVKGSQDDEISFLKQAQRFITRRASA